MITTTIVVPCHNEAQRLRVAQFRKFVSEHRDVLFLLVNDGSQDDTLAILHQLAGWDPIHFEVLNLTRNSGKAEAVRQGVLHAATRQPRYIGFWDADLATPLDAIPQFTAVLERRAEIELLLGVRLPLLGRAIRRRPMRRLLGKAFAKAASAALGVSFHDTQCGAKMFRCCSDILTAFSQPFQSRWIFDVELLARLIRLRRGSSQSPLREIIYELPLDEWQDVAGSNLKRSDFFKAVAELSSIWWRYLRPAAPPFIGTSVNVDSQSVDQATSRRAA